MYNLIDLPVEIGALIFNYVDLKSKISAYKVVQLRQFYVPNVMRKFDVSRSSLASVKTLSLDLFQDLAANIHELNLSGTRNLTASQLSPHLQRCSNLKTLDITFTSITLSDLHDICPENLKNISVNFFKWPRKQRRNKVWKKSLELFKRQRFENIHFVVYEPFYTVSPLLFMHEVPKTKGLKITITDNYRDRARDEQGRAGHDELPDIDGNVEIHFEKLDYVFLYCRLSMPPLFYASRLKGVSNLDYNQIEYILIKYNGVEKDQKIDIFISPIFSSIFATNYSNLEVTTHLPLNFLVQGNMCFKAWNKSFTEFNDAFFKTVLIELGDYLPTYLCMHDKMEMNLTRAPSNWYCIDYCQGFERILNKLPQNVTLTNFCRAVDDVLPTDGPVHLTQSGILKNITFLGLRDICPREDFFATLFSQCKNLYTLDVDIFERGHCTLYLSNSVHLAESLRNMRLVLPSIEYEMLFASLCQCPTLQNIHVCDYDRDLDSTVDSKNIVLFIKKCLDLYSLFIETNMRRDDMTSLKTSLRVAAQALGRDYLWIKVYRYYSRWNPFADVFNPSPLQVLN